MIPVALAMAAGAALIAVHPYPSHSPVGERAPSLSQREREGAPTARKGEGDIVVVIDSLAARYNLAGEILLARGDHILLDKGYGPVAPNKTTKHKAGARWRLASITKQVTATLAMQDIAAGRLALDTPVAFVGDTPFTVTPRALLTHHSGLANPDASAPAGGVPSFYRGRAPDISYCTSRSPTAGAAFSYNNCDYILLGVALDRLAMPLARRWPAGMTMARPDVRTVAGFVGGRPEPYYELASYGAAGGLTGTARAVFRFDRALLTGMLLPPRARAALWKPEGGQSYQALGQWVFPGQLEGCASPKRVVQRDGEIGGVQARNFILPDDDLVVIVFTNRSSDDFQLGEVWEGKGFVYDLLSATACG